MSTARVFIDRRPLYQILLERTGRFWILLALFALLGWFVGREPWEGLSRQGHNAIGAFVLCAVLWLTQLIPMAITGLLAIIIIPLLGILDSKTAYSFFGSEAVFFILGAFILSAAIMKTGLSTRLSILLLKRADKSPRQLVLRILLATAFLSCIMSEHAVAAFVFPIVLEIARVLEYEPFGGEYGKTLFLAMAWGCIIGGIVTFLGGARAPLAIGFLREFTGQSIGFFTWMKTTVFVAVPLFIIAYFLLTRYFRTDVASVGNVSVVLEKKRKEMGVLSFKEGMVGLILLGALFFWVTQGETAGLGNISILAVVVLFVFKLVSWKDIEEYVNWGIILMYGGAITLGIAVDKSGALQWIATQVIFIPQMMDGFLGSTAAFWLVTILSLAAIFLTELFSNAAVVALLLPTAMAMAGQFGVEPATMVYSIAIASGLGFVMPMGTPAVAIAYSSGYLKVRDIVVPGLILNLCGWLFFTLVAKFIWPLMGMDL